MNNLDPHRSRKVADGVVTLHVGPTGYSTIQDAVNALMWEWDLRGSRAKIKVAPGLYRECIDIRGNPSGSTARPAIVLEGSGSCVIHVDKGPAIENRGGDIAIMGFQLKAERGACIYGHDGGQTLIGAVEFGQSGGEHILAARGHSIRHKADYVISGGATIHAHVVDAATYGNGRSVTLECEPHFSEEFHGLNFAKSRWTGTRFIGSATGVRHLIHFNSVCAIGGADPAAFFPGDRPGILRSFSTIA